ncbi:MAG TPA: 50S ribosomal protein L4 [Bacilli bacterium]|jgi:large subunit ribosomal protein L4|nr:50S ribosomal protein L4 [Bacilli bacterium]HNY74313.1 50S ribosomal protein L4 [Bacilli bacterium]HOF53504.1 50S ribosomal protein L4 [Bacilli bacterium]HOH68176.1 50S ribosomal protein L4 [Bacilli bacterium]HOR20428.1 50S ribosomal protein L4 [Bacilli bacterium]
MAENKKVSVPVYNQLGEKVSTVSLKGEVFNVEVNNSAMFDAVNVYRSNMRQATSKTKKRDEVSGGGKKPWRQKGTGRARAGSSRSPIWVGGGIVFGPTGDQNYTLQQNKKEHRLALKSALTLKVKDGLKVVDNLELKEIKTKSFVEIVKALKAEGRILVVLTDVEENLALSARNLTNVTITVPTNVSVYDLLNNQSVIMSKAAVKALEEVLI